MENSLGGARERAGRVEIEGNVGREGEREKE